MKFCLTAISLALSLAIVSPLAVTAQTAKVGVLPFSDATASGGANIGDTLCRLTQAEIVHSTQLQGQVILITDGTRPEQLDSAKIITLGKDAGVDIVVMGTLLALMPNRRAALVIAGAEQTAVQRGAPALTPTTLREGHD